MDLDFILYIVFKILNIIKIIGITVLILIGIVIFIVNRPRFYYVNGFRFTIHNEILIMGKWTPFIPFSKKDCIELGGLSNIDVLAQHIEIAFIDETHYALMSCQSIPVPKSGKYQCVDFVGDCDISSFRSRYPIKKNYITLLSEWGGIGYDMMMLYPTNDKIKVLIERTSWNWDTDLVEPDYFDKQ